MASELPIAPLPPLAPRARLRYDIVARAIGALNPASILEIGCGQGAVGARLAARYHYVGVERDETSLAVARQRIEPPGGRLIAASYDTIPTSDKYDLVCAFEVLEHIEDDYAAARQWATHVRPGHQLIVSVPAFQERFGPMDTHAGHFRRYSPEQLADRLVAAGLRVDEVIVYGWPVGYALEVVRNVHAARELTAVAASGGISMEQQTAASGRILQPSGRAMGLAVEAAMLPFRYLQRLRPSRGVGLVAVATLPA